MTDNTYSYKINQATEHDIFSHFDATDECFILYLQRRVNIVDYVKKIVAKSIKFEAWHDDKLVGFVAIYINSNTTSYITNVSVAKNYIGKGIATTLMNNCIKYARAIGILTIELEVLKVNFQARSLYQKLEFNEYEVRHDSILMKLNLSKY